MLSHLLKVGEKHPFKSNYQGFMVSIGSRYGVANLFGKIKLSGFFAMFMKHVVNSENTSLTFVLDIICSNTSCMNSSILKMKEILCRGHSSRYGNVL